MRNKYGTVVWLVAIACTLVAGGTARAEYIPWKYNWARDKEFVYANSPSTGYIRLSDEPLLSAEGSSDIVATNLKLFSEATSLKPDIWTNKDYTLTLYILDVDSGKDGTLDFSGLFNGRATKASAKIRNKFTGLTTQKLPLGDNLYVVTINAYTPPGPPGATREGAIGATAEVTVTKITNTPEPSTLLLACIGVPLSSWLAWRRRRRAIAL